MTVKELKDKLNNLPDEDYGHLSVVVTLKDVSVGPVANTELEGGIAGFDWETGLFLFDTKEPIERYKEEREKDKAKLNSIFLEMGMDRDVASIISGMKDRRRDDKEKDKKSVDNRNRR